MTRQRFAFISAGLTGLTCAVLASSGLTLKMNGCEVSTRLEMIRGEAFVPVADVAKALGQNVAKTSRGYEIASPGGTGQIQGSRQGKLGDVLFTGEFRFQVLSLDSSNVYPTRYQAKTLTITPSGSNDVLAVVNCRVKNGTTQKQELVLATGHYGGAHTALTDDEGHAYPPLDWRGNTFGGYDAHMDDSFPDGAFLLPGASADFSLVFSIPRGAHPKDLIFSLLKYSDRDKAEEKTVDVRVSLHP